MVKSQAFTVNVTNVNEAPALNTISAISLTDTAAADTFANQTGTLTATDPENDTLSYGITGGTTNGTDVFSAITYDIKKDGTYGTLYLASTGANKGKYVFVPNASAINALSASTTENFAITASDGSLNGSGTLTVNLTGANDTPTITAGAQSATVVEAGGVSNGTTGTASATIALTTGDVDGTASYSTSYLNSNGWSTADSSATYTKAGTYGTATLTIATGVVSYALNNASAATQALTAGQSVTDSFTVQVTDGAATANVAATFAITGANDAAVISGTSTGAVTEAGGVANGTPGTPTATGTLTSTDVDGTANLFTAITAGAASTGGYGTYGMNTAGVWTYTLNNSNATVQALAAAATLSDTFTVSTADGTTQTVTVTITGANDAAIVSGTTTGAVTEAGGVANGTPGTPTATGTLTSTDVDGTANLFTATTAGAASAGGYGTYGMNTAGVWTYTLNNSNATVQALAAAATLNDTFTVSTADGTAQVVTVTITGANDTPVLTTPGAISLTDTAAVDTFSDQTGNLNATDADTGTTLTYGISSGSSNSTTINSVTYNVSLTGTYGTLYLNSSTGAYLYRPNATAINALNADASETFTVTASDGSLSTSSTLTVNLTGTADLPTPGQATIDLGTVNGVAMGKLMAPVRVEGLYYYAWDLNGDGAINESSVNGKYDRITHDFLDTYFNNDVNGVVNTTVTNFDNVKGTTNTYHYAMFNGVKLSLTTTGVSSTGTAAMTDYTNIGGGSSSNNGSNTGTGTAANDPTPNSNVYYNDLTAIWDAHNIAGSSFGAPPSWYAGRNYWAANDVPGTGHMWVDFYTGTYGSSADTTMTGLVALQVLQPATFTAASYERVTNTFKLTGTNMGSVGEVGTDIKHYIDWTQFGYDTDNNGTSDVSFVESDITSAKVIDATTLEVVLGSTKAAAFEVTTNFDTTSAAVGNADHLILASNTANSYSNAANLGVTQSRAGESVIDLGSYGKLIAGIQVEGKWYYHWDRSGDGTSDNTGSLNGGVDYVNHDTLDGIFKYDINGNLNPNAGTNTTETYRYATLNGVQVALPTYGAGVDGSGKASPTGVYKAGTSASNNTTTDNPTYNDLLAIWDSQNGSTVGATIVSGTPAGWQDYHYWSATPSVSGHAYVYLNSGLVNDNYDVNNSYVALQVL